ncbi:MarR family winged helix-turn-helix transcriptional regulator [Streptomyces indonesiensis]
MANEKERVLAELGKVIQGYQAAVDDSDRETARLLGVNETDLRCLELLIDAEELSPRELSRQLGLTTGSVTAMLDRLERLGLLTRAPHPVDRRKSVVKVTSEGSALLRAHRPAHRGRGAGTRHEVQRGAVGTGHGLPAVHHRAPEPTHRTPAGPPRPGGGTPRPRRARWQPRHQARPLSALSGRRQAAGGRRPAARRRQAAGGQPLDAGGYVLASELPRSGHSDDASMSITRARRAAGCGFRARPG